MTRINKNLLLIATLVLALGVFTMLAVQKLIPIFSQTLYYCQSFINSLASPIPPHISSIPLLIFMILTSVAIVKLFFIYIKVRQSRNKLLLSRIEKENLSRLLKKLHLEDKAYFIDSKKNFAFCLGIRNPKIYISTNLVDMLTQIELEAVLRHERYHLKKRDTLTMLIASLGESLLPFFPLLSDIIGNYKIEREIKADNEAVAGLSDELPLISALRKLLTTPSMQPVTSSSIADADTLEPRIQALTKKKIQGKKFKIINVIVSLFSIAVITTVMLAPVHAFEVINDGEEAMMLCPQGDKCAEACRQKYSSEKMNYTESLKYSPAAK